MFMSKSRPIILVVALLVFTMVLSSSVMIAHAANYVPAVIGGQWAEYKIKSQTCQSNIPGFCQSQSSGTLDNTDFGALRIETVVGSQVTLDFLTVYKNGTGSSQGVMVDVAIGSSNFTALTTGPPADYFVLAGGLHEGDTIWSTANAPRLNGTLTQTVLGSPRAVNILNFTTVTSMSGVSFSSKYGFAWDKLSGLFVELSFDIYASFYIGGQSGYSEVRLAVGMVDNNIWASPGSSSLPDFGIDAGPTALTVSPPGASGNITVNIVRIKGFSATVSLTVTTSSSALACTLTPNKLYVSGPDTAKLSCHGSLGTYTVTVKGDSGYSTHTKTVTMNVVSTPAASSQLNNMQMILIYAGIGAAAAVIVATVTVLFLRKKEPEPMVAPSETPVPPSPPTQS